jgi:hypothetical protein
MVKSDYMKKSSMFVLVAMLMAASLFGQQGATGIYSESLGITRTGMYVLGGWAVANMAAGAYGWATATGPAKYFGQMNLFWNVINLSIAGVGIYTNQNTGFNDMAATEMLSKMVKTENILLINAGLDVAYMGAGFLLRHYSARSVNRHDMLKGYGNSVILQGAFLFVFDLALYGILHSHRMGGGFELASALTPGNLNLQLGAGIQGFRLAINF